MLWYAVGYRREKMRSKQRRELRSSIRRSFILDKAEALFLEKGYNSTSMNDIAGACDCKAANIYNFFTGKEAILYEVIRDINLELLELISPLENDETTTPVELLKKLIKTHFAFHTGLKKSMITVTDTGLKNLTAEHRKEYELRRATKRFFRKPASGLENGELTDMTRRMSAIHCLDNHSKLVWFSVKENFSVEGWVTHYSEFVYNGTSKPTIKKGRSLEATGLFQLTRLLLFLQGRG
jgi:AcrR family transcriptional regulator